MHNYANYVWLEGPVEQYLAGLEAHVRLSLREILEQATCVRDTEDAEEDVARNVQSAGEFEDVGVSRCVKRFP